MMLYQWTNPTPNTIVEGKELKEADGSNYLGCCISHGGRISDEVSSCTWGVELTFINWRHLWRWDQKSSVWSTSEVGSGRCV